ncbi:MAG: hypothetical protein HY720_15630 [Planctomycetes bacterium]|nr:hypothetical protein [Planctomycetota bacterium]
MEFKFDEVSIRCMGCRAENTLEGAIQDEWRICDHCHFFICRFCLENLGDERYCLSYACRQAHRPIEAGPVPIERVLLFARVERARSRKKGLLYKLFFADGPGLDLPFVLREVEEEPDEDDPSRRPATVQEEVWRNHRLVVTKRRAGKFITWEKIF